jgi:hypothetical protein
MSAVAAATPESDPERTIHAQRSPYAPKVPLKRLTIRVPEEIFEKACRAVAEGRFDSISAYFVGMAAREPDWTRARTIIEKMIEDAGGIDDEAEEWADRVLDGVSDRQARKRNK